MDKELSTDIKIYYTTNLANHGLVLQAAINILNQAFQNRGISQIDMIDTIKIRFYVLTLLRIFFKYTNGILNVDFQKLEEIFNKNLTTLPALSSLFKIVGNNIVLFEDITIFGLRTDIDFNIFEILPLPINFKPPLPANRDFIKIFRNVKIFKFLDYDNTTPALATDIATISTHPNNLRIEVCHDNDAFPHRSRTPIDINNNFHLKCNNITLVNDINYLIHPNKQSRALITSAALFHTYSNDHLKNIDQAHGRGVFLYTCDLYKQINIFLEYHIYNMICMIPCDINSPFHLPPNFVYPHVIIDNIDQVFADHSALVLRYNLGNYIKLFNDSQNDLYVYRYQSMNLFQYSHNDESLFNMTVGKQLFFPIYLSTTLTDNTYDNYFVNPTSVLFKIKLDLSNILNLKDFLIITSESNYPSEQEILINRNSMFNITGIKDVLITGNHGRLTIKCIELDFINCIPSNTCSAYDSTTFMNNFPPGPIPAPVNQNDIKYKQLSFFGGVYPNLLNTTKKVVNDTKQYSKLKEFKYNSPINLILPDISKIKNLHLIQKFDEYKLFYVNYMNLFNIKDININKQKSNELFQNLYEHITKFICGNSIIKTESNDKFEKKYLKYKNKYLLQKNNNK